MSSCEVTGRMRYSAQANGTVKLSDRARAAASANKAVLDGYVCASVQWWDRRRPTTNKARR